MQKRKKEKIFFSIGVKRAVSNRYLLKNVRSKRSVFCVESKKLLSVFYWSHRLPVVPETITERVDEARMEVE